MQVTTMANILNDDAKMEANIKPLSKEVTVMTMEDMDSHSTAKQVMWSYAFVVGDSIKIKWFINS